MANDTTPFIVRAAATAVKTGQKQTINELLPTVAKKSGEMRKTVEKAFDVKSFELVVNRETRTIKIRLDRLGKKDLSATHYAKYHFHPGSKFGSSYKDPTTEGTRPQDTRQWRRVFTKNVNAAIPSAFKKQGITAI